MAEFKRSSPGDASFRDLPTGQYPPPPGSDASGVPPASPVESAKAVEPDAAALDALRERTTERDAAREASAVTIIGAPVDVRPPPATPPNTPAPKQKGGLAAAPTIATPWAEVKKAEEPPRPPPPGAKTEMPRPTREIQDLSSDRLLSSCPRVPCGDRELPLLGELPLLAKIGAGGMAAVYYAIHPRLRREVAVKILPFQMAGTLEDRFRREAQVAAQLDSPHVVRVIETDEANGVMFMVLEYVAGCSAGEYGKVSGKAGKQGLAEADALDIIIGATRGLAAAHDKGIVHRDVKPDNVLVPRDAEGRMDPAGAKLSDLGIASSQAFNQTLTATQVAMGTPGFMAPEQAKDAKRVGRGADIFSMGATLYALLAGKPPFEGDTPIAIVLATVQKPHRPIEKIRTDLLPDTIRLVNRCLQKEPNQRFPDARLLLDALAAARAKLPDAKPKRKEERPPVAANSPPKPRAEPVKKAPEPSTPTPPATDGESGGKIWRRHASALGRERRAILREFREGEAGYDVFAEKEKTAPPDPLSPKQQLLRYVWPRAPWVLYFAYSTIRQLVDAAHVDLVHYLTLLVHNVGHAIAREAKLEAEIPLAVALPGLLGLIAVVWPAVARMPFAALVGAGVLGSYLHLVAIGIAEAGEIGSTLQRYEWYTGPHDFGWIMLRGDWMTFKPAFVVIVHMLSRLACATAVLGGGWLIAHRWEKLKAARRGLH